MIKTEEYRMPAASLGEMNPLPDIKNISYIHAGYTCSQEIRRALPHLGRGMINTMLPYKIQDGYNRDRRERVFFAVVLENQFLRAVFLPELGGRLWSLYDKKAKRDLLYRNPVFQPANLGLRNAWFSGGVEFNVGIKGHSPLTASPVFCEIAKTDKGDVLNLYEYERIRGIVYTVSAYLPEDSPILYLKCRIENNSDEEKYMYWWSNIAVRETPKTRILVPVEQAILCSYRASRYELDMTPIPNAMGTDVSYPKNLRASHDFFYPIPHDTPKWIAAVEEDGYGLLHCSTDLLKSRKLFVWGQSAGGRNWNEWLSEPGQSYVEIQAGLASTQLEHIPMPPRCEWSWVEAYSAVRCAPDILHSSDWNTATHEVDAWIQKNIGNTRDIPFPDESHALSRRIIFRGSNFGGLESLLRGEPVSRYHKFPIDENDAETSDFTALLMGGTFPVPKIQKEPPCYVVGDGWRKKLEALPESWVRDLHLGIVYYAQGETKKAEAAWESSVRCAPSPWALRNLAMLWKNEYGDPDKARAFMEKAIRLKSDCTALITEYAMLLTSCESDEQWLSVYAALDEKRKENGRLKLYTALALLHLDRVEEAAAIVNASFVMPDIKEGELSISNIWFSIYRRLYEKQFGVFDADAADAMYPLPKSLDFRMHTQKEDDNR